MAARTLRRGRRGISELMAVLLMIIAAIAIAALVWMYAGSQAQTLSRNPKIDIVDAKIISTGTGGSGVIGVKNTGSVMVQVTSVTTSGSSGSCSASGLPVQVNPGQTAYIDLSCSGIQSGDKMIVEVKGTAVGSGEPVIAMSAVVVM